MEQQIKQRLVGAVVLVALGVIFLPMVLNGPAVSETGGIPGGIPPEPTPTAPPALTLTRAVPTVLPVEGANPTAAPSPKPQAKPRSIAQPAPTAKPTAKPSPTRKTVKPSPKPTPAKAASSKSQSASPVAWSVQVGSFTEKSKAYGFRDRLRKAGYATYVVAPKTGSRYYKVRVGPELEQSRARKVMERLKAKQKVDGFLVKHQ